MSGERLRAGYLWHLVSEDAKEGSALGDVVIGCAGAMCIDVLDVGWIELCHGECIAHSEECAFAIVGGSGLMECIAAVGVSGDVSLCLCAVFLEYEECSSFA